MLEKVEYHHDTTFVLFLSFAPINNLVIFCLLFASFLCLRLPLHFSFFVSVCLFVFLYFSAFCLSICLLLSFSYLSFVSSFFTPLFLLFTSLSVHLSFFRSFLSFFPLFLTSFCPLSMCLSLFVYLLFFVFLFNFPRRIKMRSRLLNRSRFFFFFLQFWTNFKRTLWNKFGLWYLWALE